MNLYIYEKLMLLAIDDYKGTVFFSASHALPYAISGALIYDLIQEGFIQFEADLIKITNFDKQIDDEILKETYNLIKEEAPQKISFWIQKLYVKIDNIKQRIIDKLVKEDILKEEQGRFLWIIPVHRFPTKNPQPELNLRLALRSCVLDGKQGSPCDIALLSLVYSCNLMEEIFSEEEYEFAEKNTKNMIESDEVGIVLRETIGFMMVAITSAVNTSIIAGTISN